MKAQVGPSSKEVSSLEELEKYLGADADVTIVGLFEKETELKGAFLKIADKLREKVRFAHSSFKDVLEKYDVKDGIILVRPAHLNNKFEEDRVKYAGGASSADIHTFINDN